MPEGFVKRYKELPVAVKASFFFILCGILKDAVDILTTPVFTRILTTEEYGLFSVYNSYYQVIRVIVSLYLFSDGFHVGMARFPEDRESFTSAIQGLGTGLFVIWISVAVCASKLWVKLTGLDSTLLFLLIIQTMFTIPLNCWQQKKKYVYEYKDVTWITAIYLLLQPAVGLLLIKLNPGQWDNGLLRIYGGVGVQILFGIVLYIIQFIRKPVFYKKPFWIFALKTNIPLLPHYLSQIILNHADRLMIDSFVGKTQTAIYTIGHAAAFVLFAVTSNLNSTFVPWLYEKLRRNETEGITHITSILCSIVGTLSVVLVLIAPEAIGVLGGEKYADSVWAVPPLTVAVYLTFLYSLFADVELYYGKNYYVLISSFLGSIANIVLNWFLIPLFGFVAAAYTTAVGYLVMSICHYLFVIKTCKQNNIRITKLFSIKVLIIVTLVTVLCCGITTLLYNKILIRYFLGVIVICVAFMKRTELLSIYRDVWKAKENNY